MFDTFSPTGRQRLVLSVFCLFFACLSPLRHASAQPPLEEWLHQGLEQDPVILAAGESLQATHRRAALAGRLEAPRIEAEWTDQRLPGGETGRGYKLHLLRTLPLDARLQRENLEARATSRLVAIDLCRLRLERITLYLEALQEWRAAERQEALAARMAGIADSLEASARLFAGRGEFSLLQAIEFRHLARQARAVVASRSGSERQARTKLAGLGFDPALLPEPHTAPAPKEQVHPGRAALQAEVELVHERMDLWRASGLRDIDLGIGLEGEREEADWNHGISLSLELPLPMRGRARDGKTYLLAKQRAAARALQTWDRELQRRTQEAKARLRSLEEQLEREAPVREALDEEWNLAQGAWREGMLAEPGLLELSLHRIQQESRELDLRLAIEDQHLRLALLRAEVPAVHDAETCRCGKEGEPIDVE